MRQIDAIDKKIYSLAQLASVVATYKTIGKTVAFTNGCFDILHEGHIFSLSQAAKEADYLVVGVNSDASVKRLKGTLRPVNNQGARSLLLASLLIVDAVVVFDEDTPLRVIETLLPNVLVKGGDYTIEQIVGAKEVIANGGKVIINSLIPNRSTTGIIDKIRSLG